MSVTRDLAGRGVKRVSGEPWAYAATMRLLDSPIYCGWVSYKGQKAHRVDPAVVEPLVSEDLYDAAVARRDAARKPGRTNARKHLLSGIAVCGRCLTPMTATGQRQGSQGIYVCNRQAGGCGNTTVTRAPLDRLIENAVKTGLFVQSSPGGDEGERLQQEAA
ncbi:recombinase zinc beta ribbon domain-containing protein [Nocardioides ultimimeridianus]